MTTIYLILIDGIGIVKLYTMIYIQSLLQYYGTIIFSTQRPKKMKALLMTCTLVIKIFFQYKCCYNILNIRHPNQSMFLKLVQLII
jgi:hypothetical protein